MFFTENKGPKVIDVVFLNEQGCTNAIARWLLQNPKGVVAVWFQKDLNMLRQTLNNFAGDRFVLSNRLSDYQSDIRPILFSGHYPLRTGEFDLCANVGIKEMLVYTHLDASLFKAFGSDRIKELMEKMGMKEDEPLSHPMITSAIANAQEKIAKQCITDLQAWSEEDWMNTNYFVQK